MATVIGAEVVVNTSGAEKSVGSLKQQLRAAQNEVTALSEKFGATSAAAINAAKNAAKLKDSIGDAKALTDAFNPDAKFKGLGQALQGVAGGFAAVQGAQALLGTESKDLEKTLLKVQGAMALSQGLNALGEAGDAFKTLGVQAVAVFNKIKVAIGSTGIGLLVIALGAIYAYWDDIKGAVSGVSKEQEKLAKSSKANLKTEQDKLSTLNNQDNTLKLQGKSERQILNLKIAQTDQVIKASEIQIESSIQLTKSQTAAAARNKQILQGILEFVTAPIALTLKGIDMIGKAVGKNFGLEEGFFGGISKFVFDPEQVQKDGDAAVKEQQDALAKLKEQRAGFQLQIKAIDTEASKKSKEQKAKDDEDAAKKEKDRLDNIIAQNKHTDDLITQNRLANIKDEFFKKQAELEVQRQVEIDAELDLLNKKLISQEQYEINKANINAKYNAQQTVLLTDNEAKKKLLEEKAAEDSKKTKQAEIDAKIELENTYFQAASAGIDILKSFAGKNKGLQRAALIAENAITIAKIVLDTQKANAAITAKYALIPGGQVPAAAEKLSNKIKAGIGIATAIAATAKGLQGIGGGGSAGGGSVGGEGGTSAPIAPALGTTALDQGQINQLSNAANRAFVLESDVSGNQERIQRLNRAARIN